MEDKTEAGLPAIKKELWVTPAGAAKGWIVVAHTGWFAEVDGELVKRKGVAPVCAAATKVEAIALAVKVQRLMSAGPDDLVELFITKRDGKIQDRRSYPRSADPKGGG